MDNTYREVFLIAIVDAEVYEGMADDEIADLIDREVVYQAGLDGVETVISVRARIREVRRSLWGTKAH